MAFREGARAALGAPAVVLFAGMAGFGALSQSVGMSFWSSVASSALIYALPGQIVMAEMLAVGASGLLVSVAAALTAARFLPMMLTVIPQIPAQHRTGRLFLMAHLVAMTTWAIAVRAFPRLAPQDRQPYFFGFGLVCWSVCIPGTALGYLMAGHVPGPLTLALVFLNPLFFLLSFTEVRPTGFRLAIIAGALLGPLSYLVSPAYSLIVSGLVGGSLAYAVQRRRQRISPGRQV
jgi:predicted branched-subunit amino acid permease